MVSGRLWTCHFKVRRASVSAEVKTWMIITRILPEVPGR